MIEITHTIIVVLRVQRRTLFISSMKWDEFKSNDSIGIVGTTRYIMVDPDDDGDRLRGLRIDGAIYINSPEIRLQQAINAKLR